MGIYMFISFHVMFESRTLNLKLLVRKPRFTSYSHSRSF